MRPRRSKPDYAVPQAVRDLLDEFRYPNVDAPVQTGAGEKGGVPRLVLAAGDASSESKAKADILCPGTTAGDGAIFANVASLFADGAGGELRLTEGTFHVEGSVIVWVDTVISGAGIGVTLLDDSTLDWTMAGSWGLRNLTVISGSET